VNLNVVVDSWSGPMVQIQLSAASPALFQLDTWNAIATEAGGALITPASPARPGDVIVLRDRARVHAAGGVWADSEERGAVETELMVELDGIAVDPGAILYSGVAPGFAGLYQINLVLLASAGANPQISIGFADSTSRAGVTLAVAP
jgi:uncharacterized protein (TIGR03437 family)